MPQSLSPSIPSPHPQAAPIPQPAALPAGGDLRWARPEHLLHPARLDVVIKALYFRSLLSARPDVEAARLYDQHIARRTGGYEDGKRTVADYHDAARRLLTSIETNGFDEAHAVPIGANGRPLDGAHRLAACLALDCPIAVRRSTASGPAWGYEWFGSHGFSSHDVDWIVRGYAHLSDRVVGLVFWGPTADGWPALIDRLASCAGVVGWRDLAFDPDEVASIVHDVYAYRLGPGTSDRIENKARALALARPHLRAVIVDAGAPGAESGLESWSARVKADLRRLVGRGPDDFFDTVHAADTVDETRYLADLLFNGNSLRQIASRRGRPARPRFLGWLTAYRAALTRHDLRQDDACIVGSAVLEVVGLREATDIDCVVVDAARRPRFHNGVTALDAGVDLVTAGYHRRADDTPVVADDALVTDPRHHFLYRGLKFANPELVIDRKRQHGRPKDLADVALWDARLEATDGPGTPALDRAVIVWDPAPIDAVGHARWQTTAARLSRRGVQAIVAGPPRTPAFFAVPCIEGPPPPDGLPSCVTTDADPLAALARIGADGTRLLEADAVVHGPPAYAGHARRRLGAFAQTARWMDRWLTTIAPAAVVVAPGTDAAGLLIASLARRQGIPVVGNVDALDAVIKAAPRRCASTPAAITDACQAANDWTALVRRAAAADALDLRVRHDDSQARELARWRAAATVLAAAHADRDIWMWGAGAAGITTAHWLADMGVDLRGVVDSDAAKRGTPIGASRVDTPDALLDASFHARRPLVVVASMQADAIVRRLRAFGAAETHIVVAPPVHSPLVDGGAA